MSVVSTCRLSSRNEAMIQDALDESGLLKSELMRRAIRHYIHENPDGFSAFTPVSGRSSQAGDYDVMELF